MSVQIDIKEEPVAWDDPDSNPNSMSSFEAVYKSHFPSGIEFVRLATNVSPAPTPAVTDRSTWPESESDLLPIQECNFPSFAAAWIKQEPLDEQETDPLCEPVVGEDEEFSSGRQPLPDVSTPPPSTSHEVVSREKPTAAQADNTTKLVTDTKPKRKRKPVVYVNNPKVKCEFCACFFVQTSLERHYAANHSGERPYLCTMCDHTFVTSDELEGHGALHNDPKPFFCELCQARFTRRGELKVHLRYHTGDRCHVCSVCDATFVTKNKLSVHERTHNGQRPFECAACDKAFTQGQHLKDHMALKHGPGKMFQCDVCPLKFARTNHLADHKRTHTGEKPFPCTKCDKSFGRRTHLVRHMCRHTGDRPFTCDTCSATFARRDDLERHIRGHTDDKRHVCGECGARFLMSHHLKVHRRTHLAAGARTWVCKLCSEEFATVGGLMSHTRKHNKEKKMAAALNLL